MPANSYIAIVLLFVVDNPAVFLSPVTAWHSLIKIQFKIHFGSLNHKSAKSHSKVNTFSCKLTGGFLNIFTFLSDKNDFTAEGLFTDKDCTIYSFPSLSKLIHCHVLEPKKNIFLSRVVHLRLKWDINLSPELS